LDVSRFLSEKEIKRQESIHELITTEQVYLTYLRLVRDEFQGPLLDLGLITSAESELFFKDWSSLLDLSQSIVDELMKRQESEQGVVFAVGDIINSHIVERAGCFLNYCANNREATNLLTQRMTESRLLREFITVRAEVSLMRVLHFAHVTWLIFALILLVARIHLFTRMPNQSHCVAGWTYSVSCFSLSSE
jgi:hypothetical protein